MKNIILIAPPAAGKGTQSKMISALYNIPHISTGDLLRDEVSSGSSMGEYLKSIMDQGGLISDDVIVNFSNKVTLGEFQYNGAMKLAKVYSEKPVDIANKIVSVMEKDKFLK